MKCALWPLAYLYYRAEALCCAYSGRHAYARESANLFCRPRLKP